MNSTVILLVRMWVEKEIGEVTVWIAQSSSLWGCELKNSATTETTESGTSSSLWGCELKKNLMAYYDSPICHPPCEDVSWKVIHHLLCSLYDRHPSCEDVSWKTCEFNDSILADGHPPCEDVSWKISGDVGKQLENRHPPCEDVSWKVNEASIRTVSWVILHVRMWVEKRMM